MTKTVVLLGGIALFAVGGCNRHGSDNEGTAPPPPPPPTAATTVAPTTPPIASVEVPTALGSAAPSGSAAVPVPEDFEAEAKRNVTSNTLDSQLDKLEKQIANAPKK